MSKDAKNLTSAAALKHCLFYKGAEKISAYHAHLISHQGHSGTARVLGSGLVVFRQVLLLNWTGTPRAV